MSVGIRLDGAEPVGGHWLTVMKADHKLLSLSIFVLASFTLFAAAPAVVFDSAKFKSLQAALDARW
jgi:hypothetical protein